MERTCPTCFKKYPEETLRCPDCQRKLISLQDQDLVGQEIDERYQILSILGKGGMGVVYVAEQAMVGRKVALKVLRRDTVQDEGSVRRFFTEARAIATLKSPHTITLHDFGITDDGLVYYTMEMLEGAPLSAVIKREGPLPVKRAVGIILQSLESLEEAHNENILHRDLKPENLFIAKRKGKDFVTLLDFGIAKLVGDTSIESVTKTGMICGTPAYLSPEQVLGNPAVPSSDLYSLAIVLYEMLAGEPPFSDTTAMKLLLKHLNKVPVPVHVKNPGVEVPRSLDAFLHRAMTKQPEERFATANDFRAALKLAISAGGPESETGQLTPLLTTSDGLRSLAPGTESYAMADSALHEQETEPRQHGHRDAVDLEGNTGVVALDSIEEAVVRVGDSSSLVSKKSGLRKAVGGGAVLLVGIALGLVLWQPWKSATEIKPEVNSAVPELRDGAVKSKVTTPNSGEEAVVVASPTGIEEEALLETEMARRKQEEEARLHSEMAKKKAVQEARLAEDLAAQKKAGEAQISSELAQQKSDEEARQAAEARKIADEENRLAAEAEAKAVEKANREALLAAEAVA